MQSAPQQLRRRRRAPRSCEECRRRKVKCDRQDPCSHCTLTWTHCGYGGRLNGAPQPTLRTGQSRDVGTRQSDRRASSNLFSSSEPADNRTSSSSTVASRPTACEDNEPDKHGHQLDELQQVVLVPALVHPASNTVSAGLGKTSSSQLLPSKNRGLLLNKSRLYGRTHWSHGGQEFRNIAHFLSNGPGVAAENEVTIRLTSEIRGLVQQCKLLAKSLKISRPSRCLTTSEPSMASKEFADTMVRAYISHFESAFRILHVPSFLAEYEQYWRDPADAATVLKFKIQLVVSIGSSLYREARDAEQVRSAARQWVHAAQHWLSGPLEKDRLSIDGLQVQCLLVFARQTLAVGGDMIWIAMGILVRTAMQLGLHRDPKHFTKMSVLQAETRRRLWATVLEMNVQAALDSGMPPNMSFHDFDTEPPSNVDDEDMDDGTELFTAHADTTVTDTSLQRILLKCLRPRLDIVCRMNGSCSDLGHDETAALSSEISKACRACSTQVKAGEGKVFRRNLVDLLLHRWLLSLHRPLVSQGSANPVWYFCRKMCLDTAMALISPTVDEDFNHLVLIGGGMFKNRMIHVSLALAGELLIDIEEQGQSLLVTAPSHYQKMLIEAVKEARCQAAKRIELGETNVRLHMKLSVTLAQVEGAGSGVPLQQRTAQAAKDSLETSRSIMQARLGSVAALSHGGDDFLPSLEANPYDLDLGFFEFRDLLQSADSSTGEVLGADQAFV